MGRLYLVDAFAYVVADSEEEAISKIHLPDGVTVVAEEAYYIDPEWKDAIPFGSDDDRTCQEVFNEQDEG